MHISFKTIIIILNMKCNFPHNAAHFDLNTGVGKVGLDGETRHSNNIFSANKIDLRYGGKPMWYAFPHI